MSAATPSPHLDDHEAAALLVQVERDGVEPNQKARDRLDATWNEGLMAAVDSGKDGIDQWLKFVAQREPERCPSIKAAVDAARDGVVFPRVAEPPTEEAAIEEAQPERPAFLRSTFTARTLAHAEFKTEWLVKGVLVENQPCVVGAPKKGMKTSVMLDLAVSLASATTFLGEFVVPKTTPVLMLSGESGGSATKRTIQQVCEAKRIALEEMGDNLHVAFSLPKLCDPGDVAGMAAYIREFGIKVVIIDPLYLCLVSGSSGRELDPRNLFDIGPLLLEVSRICLEAGATPILVHHNTKSSAGGNPYDVPELSNLAYAGIQEFARQWILLNRRERYEPGTGLHKLWLAVGGSAGHSGEWTIDVDEGVMDEEFQGRKWNVQVRKAWEQRAEEHEARTTAKATKQREKEIDQLAEFRAQEDKVLAVVRSASGGRCSKSYAYDAAKLKATVGRPTIARLLADNRLIEVQIEVKKGKGKTIEWGVGIPELCGTLPNSAELCGDGVQGSERTLPNSAGGPPTT